MNGTVSPNCADVPLRNNSLTLCVLIGAASADGPERATDPVGREAVAQFDFDGRTSRELTFKKGDVITLIHRRSADWWEGSLRGTTGYVPDKYLKILASHSRPR